MDLLLTEMGGVKPHARVLYFFVTRGDSFDEIDSSVRGMI